MDDEKCYHPGWLFLEKMELKTQALAVKPFLRWAGSKRKQLPVLREYWSTDFERYVEPFAGSACFFLSVGPSSALLADKE